jgi:chromosome segregation ATPase
MPPIAVHCIHSYVHMAERTEAAIENTEADIRLLIQQRDEMNREIQSLDKALRATAGIESEIQRLQDIQSNMRQIRDDLAKHEEEYKALLAQAWGDLVDPVVSRKIEEFRRGQETHIRSLERIGKIRSRLKQIAELEANKICPTCGQAYPDHMLHGADRDLTALQVELESLQLDQDRLAYLGDAIRKLSRVKTIGVATSLRTDRRRYPASKCESGGLGE